MAISLKSLSDSSSNHETRIKKLEQGFSSGTFSITTLATASNTLSQSMTNFKMLCIEFSFWGARGYWQTVPVELFKKVKYIRYQNRGGENADRGYDFGIDYVSDTQVKAWGPYHKLEAVYGLKLYYNFSYNIIRKFLSKIKIKLKSYLEALPKKKGGEDRNGN